LRSLGGAKILIDSGAALLASYKLAQFKLVMAKTSTHLNAICGIIICRPLWRGLVA
jgi:hypothetical protein